MIVKYKNKYYAVLEVKNEDIILSDGISNQTVKKSEIIQIQDIMYEYSALHNSTQKLLQSLQCKFDRQNRR
jgi:hypothetical protein